MNSRGRMESLSSLSFPHMCHVHAGEAVFLPPPRFCHDYDWNRGTKMNRPRGFNLTIGELNVHAVSHGEVKSKRTKRVSIVGVGWASFSLEVISVSM